MTIAVSYKMKRETALAIEDKRGEENSSEREASSHSLSVVVPAYNSEGSLRDLAARLAQVLSAISKQHEVILVNDGSRDRTWEVICQLSPGLSLDPRHQLDAQLRPT